MLARMIERKLVRDIVLVLIVKVAALVTIWALFFANLPAAD